MIEFPSWVWLIPVWITGIICGTLLLNRLLDWLDKSSERTWKFMNQEQQPMYQYQTTNSLKDLDVEGDEGQEEAVLLSYFVNELDFETPKSLSEEIIPLLINRAKEKIGEIIEDHLPHTKWCRGDSLEITYDIFLGTPKDGEIQKERSRKYFQEKKEKKDKPLTLKQMKMVIDHLLEENPCFATYSIPAIYGLDVKGEQIILT